MEHEEDLVSHQHPLPPRASWILELRRAGALHPATKKTYTPTCDMLETDKTGQPSHLDLPGTWSPDICKTYAALTSRYWYSVYCAGPILLEDPVRHPLPHRLQGSSGTKELIIYDFNNL